MPRAAQGRLMLVFALVAIVASGMECPTPQLFPPSETGVVTLRLQNQSGIRAKVMSEFVLEDFQVRETLRILGETGQDAAATLLPTRTRFIRVLATVADDANLTQSAFLKPGDVLAQASFEWSVDFGDGDSLDFIIPPLEPPADFLDCNSNGVSDAIDIATGASIDCNDNAIPDECDIAAGTSLDCQPNGIPDECEIEPSAEERSDMVPTSINGLLFPLDGSYTLAMGPNDDGSTGEIPLGFDFQFYGETYNSVFINNNGNLSFGAAYPNFTSTGFPVSGFPMVAPFWADVDTRSELGAVWYKLESNALIVTWDAVGYFNQQGDKRNTFQVAISDGTHPLIGIGVNVAFSFGDMQWTTGSASDGVLGFGGVPATVGANAGDNEDFFQIGRFDKAGTDYDGPFGNTDGVDYLDGQVIRFSTATGGANIPPIGTGLPPSGLVRVNPAIGETLSLAVQFLSPEADQTTTVAVQDVNGALGRGMQVVNTPGTTASLQFTWSPTCADSGLYEIHMDAQDTFEPAGTSSASFTVLVICLSEDCNGNGIPDECETDCDGNGRPDDCDIAECTSQPACSDCNENGIPDSCDLAGEFSEDADSNGVPDECEGGFKVILRGPQSYLKRADAPTPGIPIDRPIIIDDFEGGGPTIGGVALSAGDVHGHGWMVDSVDEDDGEIDGTGTMGHSLYVADGATGVSFTFDETALGGLPQWVGIVWTDGAGETTFEAFDTDGQSIGVIGPVQVANGEPEGDTGNDYYFGVEYLSGISRIHIRNSSGHLEVDHLQFTQP